MAVREPPVHEMGIALEIHRVCLDAIAPQGDGRIETVRLAVGELSAVEPDLLRFAWEAVVADGPHAGDLILLVETAALLSIGLTLGALFFGGRPTRGGDSTPVADP